MKKTIATLFLLGTVGLNADFFKHDLQVFTANTMEIPCSGTPKVLYFGEYEKVSQQSAQEMKNIINSGISQVGASAGSWVGANGIDGASLGANLGAGLIGSYLGTKFKNAVYASMDDPEYLMVSECNSGKSYTRLITMVISEEKLGLDVVKQYALKDQRKMARKVHR